MLYQMVDYLYDPEGYIWPSHRIRQGDLDLIVNCGKYLCHQPSLCLYFGHNDIKSIKVIYLKSRGQIIVIGTYQRNQNLFQKSVICLICYYLTEFPKFYPTGSPFLEYGGYGAGAH